MRTVINVCGSNPGASGVNVITSFADDQDKAPFTDGSRENACSTLLVSIGWLK